MRKKPLFNYNSTKQLLEYWSEDKITLAELRQHGVEGRLHFGVKWNELRESNFNVRCSIDEDWLDISPEALKGPGMINLCNIMCKDKSDCKFVPPEIYLQEASDEERDNLGKMICSFENLFVSRDEVKNFDNLFGDIPPYLNSDHLDHSKELAAAVEAWMAIYVNKENLDPNKTYKQNIGKWIEDKQLKENKYLSIKGDINKTDSALGRVATMIGKDGCKKLKNLN